MFITLLLVTLLIALATSLLVMRLFDKMIRKILDRLVSAELSAAWNRYLSLDLAEWGALNGASRPGNGRSGYAIHAAHE